MSILPHTPSISPKVAATVLPSTQGSATTPPQRPSHGDGNVLVPEPTPQYTQTLGIPSPSARTSFTRVDNVTDNIETQPTQPSCVMSQDRDHRSVSEASYPENGNGLEQSPLSLQGLPQQIASTAAITEPGASFPIMTTRVDESASQKAFVQEQEDVPQTPQAFLTFLLVSGKKRTMSFEQDTTIGRVKELIWNAWPSGMCSFHFPEFYSPTLSQSGKKTAHQRLHSCALYIWARCYRTMKFWPVRPFCFTRCQPNYMYLQSWEFSHVYLRYLSQRLSIYQYGLTDLVRRMVLLKRSGKIMMVCSSKLGQHLLQECLQFWPDRPIQTPKPVVAIVSSAETR